MKVSEDRPSMENHGARTSSSWSAPSPSPPAADGAARGGRPAQRRAAGRESWWGQGARWRRAAEVEQLADMLAAPVAKALLGQGGFCPMTRPFTTGGIGHLGTAPSEWAMHAL